jgi:hypothetical protein
MAFWSSTSLDPKRQYKFKVKFDKLGTDATYLAQSADRPVWTVTDGTKVEFLDKSFHFPGKVSWNQVKIKFVDAAAGGTNVSAAVYKYLSESGWITPTTPPAGDGTFATFGKPKATSGMNVYIDVLDTNGASIDKWQLMNAFVTTAALNNLDYAAEAILTAEFTFRYDWAEYK